MLMLQTTNTTLMLQTTNTAITRFSIARLLRLHCLPWKHRQWDGDDNDDHDDGGDDNGISLTTATR